MIIFDLDGTLADCEHRRHFVDRSHPINEKQRLSEISLENTQHPDPNPRTWRPDWKSFYQACDKDEPIEHTIKICNMLRKDHYVEIWSGRCSSVLDKTQAWLRKYLPLNKKTPSWGLRMRPIGDNTPDDELKEIWLEETYEETKWGRRSPIEFVFDDRPKVIRMWRRRGIFVFNCCQHDEEF